MKRKKFVKQLMSKGLPRNKANFIAKFLQEKNVPYSCFAIGYVLKLENGMHLVDATVPYKYARVFRGTTPCGEILGGRFSCDLLPGKEKILLGSRIKMPEQKGSNAVQWWLRSPYSQNDNSFVRTLTGRWVGI